jgi:hypothetical protein
VTLGELGGIVGVLVFDILGFSVEHLWKLQLIL